MQALRLPRATLRPAAAAGSRRAAGAQPLARPFRRSTSLARAGDDDVPFVDGEVVSDAGVGSSDASEDAIASPLARLQELAEERQDEELSEVVADLAAAASASADRAAAAAAAAAEAEAAVKAGKDSLLRLSAEFQNFRNRTEREKGEISDRVKGSVLEELIPLVDNFEAAKQFIKPVSEGEIKIEAAYQALYKQMNALFSKLGIEQVQTVGQPFDPAVHEAIARVPTADHPPDTVSVEYRKGFLVGGRLVRPATVAVAVPQEEAAAEEPAAEGAAEEAAAE